MKRELLRFLLIGFICLIVGFLFMLLTIMAAEQRNRRYAELSFTKSAKLPHFTKSIAEVNFFTIKRSNIREYGSTKIHERPAESVRIAKRESVDPDHPP